jgi:uncharacterized protein HemY
VHWFALYGTSSYGCCIIGVSMCTVLAGMVVAVVVMVMVVMTLVVFLKGPARVGWRSEAHSAHARVLRRPEDPPHC